MLDSIFAHNFPKAIVIEYFDIFIMVSLLSTFTRFGVNDNVCFSKNKNEVVLIDRLSLISIACLIIISIFLLISKFNFWIASLAILWMLSLNTVQVLQDFYKTIPKYFLANFSTLLNRILTLSVVISLVLIEKYSLGSLIFFIAFVHTISCILFLVCHLLLPHSLEIQFQRWGKLIFMKNLRYGINNIIQSIQPQLILLIIIVTGPTNVVEIMFAFKFVAIGGVLNIFIEKSYIGVHKEYGSRAINYFFLGISIFYILVFVFMYFYALDILQLIYADYAENMSIYVYLFLVYAGVSSYIVLLTYYLNIEIGIQRIYFVNLGNLIFFLFFLFFAKELSFEAIVGGLIILRIVVLTVYARLIRVGLR